jgi:hypothetical protein
MSTRNPNQSFTVFPGLTSALLEDCWAFLLSSSLRIVLTSGVFITFFTACRVPYLPVLSAIPSIFLTAIHPVLGHFNYCLPKFTPYPVLANFGIS